MTEQKMKETKPVGGQAVIEGVMMRSSERISTAVRKKDGNIIVRNQDYISLTRRYRLLGWPLLRGIVIFIETLTIGIMTLNFSADVALQEEEKEHPSKKAKSNAFLLGGTVVVALGLGLLVFFFTPLLMVTLLKAKTGALPFNLTVGLIRIIFFIAYVWLISHFRELRRVFEYHGAEHKSIFAYEAGEKLSEETASKYSTKHPRCGTSFLFIVAILAIFVFAFGDALFAHLYGHLPNLPHRLIYHLLLIPLIAGVSYELLRLSGKRRGFLVRLLSTPGLWLQRITTKEPSPEQLKVAIVALKESLFIPTVDD